MNKKDIDLTKPNRRMIEQLFRELIHDRHQKVYDEYSQLRLEHDEIAKKLYTDPEYKKSKAKMDKAWQKWHDYEEAAKVEVRRVKMLYLSQGITPEVLKEVDSLVRRFGK